MRDQSAFRATFTDWRLVKGRKVVQVVMEVPLELADQAYHVLGGMPDPGKSVWCAVARLNENAAGEGAKEGEAPSSDSSPDDALPRPRKPLIAFPLPQQAVLLCKNPIFQAYLREEAGLDVHDDDGATVAIRRLCAVGSRRELQPDNPAGRHFLGIRDKFMAWMLVA